MIRASLRVVRRKLIRDSYKVSPFADVITKAELSLHLFHRPLVLVSPGFEPSAADCWAGYPTVLTGQLTM